MKLVYIIIFVLHSGFLLAQHGEINDHSSEHSHAHNNHFAVFSGVTSQLDHKENSYTLGLDYMYFFPKYEHWGISAFGEAIFTKKINWVFGTPVVYKANKHVWLRFGPGFEILKDKDNHSHFEMLLRIGGGYDFHVGNITLSPSLDIDIVREHAALVVGLNIGFGF